MKERGALPLARGHRGANMERAVDLAERAGGAAVEGCLDLGHDGERDLLGRFSAEVQADRAVNAWRIAHAAPQFLAASLRPQQADVLDRAGEKRLEQGL